MKAAKKYDCLVVAGNREISVTLGKSLLYNKAVLEILPVNRTKLQNSASVAAIKYEDMVIHAVGIPGLNNVKFYNYKSVLVAVSKCSDIAVLENLVDLIGDKIVTLMYNVPADQSSLISLMIARIYHDRCIRNNNIITCDSINGKIMSELRLLIGGNIAVFQNDMIMVGELNAYFSNSVGRNPNNTDNVHILDVILFIANRSEYLKNFLLHPKDKAELTSDIMLRYIELQLSPGFLLNRKTYLGVDGVTSSAVKTVYNLLPYLRLSKTVRTHIIRYLENTSTEVAHRFFEYLHPLEIIMALHKTGNTEYVPQNVFLFQWADIESLEYKECAELRADFWRFIQNLPASRSMGYKNVIYAIYKFMNMDVVGIHFRYKVAKNIADYIEMAKVFVNDPKMDPDVKNARINTLFHDIHIGKE